MSEGPLSMSEGPLSMSEGPLSMSEGPLSMSEGPSGPSEVGKLCIINRQAVFHCGHVICGSYIYGYIPTSGNCVAL